MKDKHGGNPIVPSKMQLNGTFAADGSSIANLFINHFSSVFSRDGPKSGYLLNTVTDKYLTHVKLRKPKYLIKSSN